VVRNIAPTAVARTALVSVLRSIVVILLFRFGCGPVTSALG
jgi:hypothetical protein